MLSRVADTIFWMSRYMERSKMETTLLYSNYVAIQDNAIDDNWRFILDHYGNKTFLKPNKNHIYHNATYFMAHLTIQWTEDRAIIL